MLPPNTYKVDDFETIRQTIFDDALNSLSNRFPLENDKYRLTVEDLGYDSIPKYTTLQQKEAVQSDKTLSAKIKGRWTLYDKNTGKIVSQSSRKTIMDVPYMTERGTFIRNGTEMTLPIQMRLVPGVYARMTDSGEAKAHINVKPGSGSQLSITMNPANPVFKVTQGTRNYKLYPLLKHMGISDEYLMNAWGKDIYKANYDDFISGGGWYSAKTAAEENPYDEITKRVFRGDLDPLETEASLGKGYKTVDPDMMVAAASKLLRISKGEAESDNRDSLENQRFLMAPELIGERVRLDAGKVGQTLLWKISRSGDVNKIPAGALNKYINGLFTESRLAQAIEETNPLDAYMRATKVTRMGEGGISGVDTAPMSARLVHNTYKGFIDPTVSPECCANHLVMSNLGWVEISKVTEDTLVACLIDGKLEYHKPYKVVSYDFNGELYCYNAKATAYEVTGNHRMWVCKIGKKAYTHVDGGWRNEYKPQYKFEYAEEMHNTNRKLMSGGHGPLSHDIITSYTIGSGDNTITFDIGDWCEFLGWYIAEGCYDHTGNSKSVVAITQDYNVNKENCDLIRNLLTRMGVTFKYKGCDFKIKSRLIRREIEPLGYCYEKFIPEEVFMAPESAQLRFIDAILRGDGRKPRGNENAVLCTTSKRLAEDYERLLFNLGFATSVKFEKDDRESRYLGCYTVRQIVGNELWLRKNGTISSKGKRQYPYFKKPYVGKVYCLSVPGGLFYTKLPGKRPFWIGNSLRAGLDSAIALNAVKGKDGFMYTPMINAISGRREYVNSLVASKVPVAFSEYRDSTQKYIPAMVGNKIEYLPKANVKYFIPNGDSLFALSSNLIPLKSGIKAGRLLMAQKHQTQAVSLSSRMAPYVQTEHPGDNTISVEKSIGKLMGAVFSKGDGKVLSVTPDEMTVRYNDGTKETISLYNNYPLNRKSYYHNESRVKPGDIIKKGQVLASSNYTDENGVSALGTQLRTAWMPFKGENYLDAIIVSEDAAKKLSSEHLYHTGVDKDSTTTIDKNAYTSAFPTKFNKDQLATIDKDGIVKPGTTVKFGDPLILSYSKREATPGSLHRALVKDNVVTWEHEFPGYITDVVNSSKGVKVYTKAYLPLQTGDKCFSEDTDMLTETGWKNIKDVTLDDKIATLNPETNVFEYLTPVALHKIPYIGYMYTIDTPQVNTCVTPYHNNFVQTRNSDHFELIKAENCFNRRISFKKDGIWNGKVVDTFTFPGLPNVKGFEDPLTIDMASYLVLLGMFLSEGSCVWNEKHRNYNVNIVQLKPEGVLALKAAENKYNIGKYFESQGRLINRDKRIVKYFMQFGHAKDKFIPNHVFALSSDQQRLLLDWLMWGDGTIKDGLYKSYTTISERLANDIQRLCLHIGIAAHIKRRKKLGGGNINGRPIMGKYICYNVKFVNKKLTPQINHGHVKVKQDFATYYNGYVYCPTMSKWNVVYTRRNGVPMWSGNCAARYANKGVTARVVPTSEMPIAADGKPIDVIFGPTGIVSRVNSAQLVEAMLGKVAAKTGKRYVLPGFMNENMVEFAKRELEQAGLTDREDLTDPTTGITIPQITVGNSYIVKMHHTAESKGGARATGSYTMDELPGGQGHDGSKLLGNLILGAIIGHGSTEVLKDMKLVKGQKNTDFWRDFKLGRTPVMPSTPLIYDKFIASLQGAGINVHKEKNTTNIFALTNKDINDFAHAEVKNSDTYSANNMAPLPGGLFDPNIFGPNGTQWGYIKLDEPVLNPVMEDPIKLILGLTEADLEAVISGNKKLPNGLTGGLGLKKQLESINMKQAVQDALNDVKNATRTKRDKAVKKYRYLSSMLKHNAGPADFMLDKIPVIPPRFRRISQSGDLTMVADANYLYRALMDNQQDVRDARNAGLPEDMVGSGNLKIYKAFKAITGLSDPEDRKLQEKQVSGLLKWVFGKGSPKCYDSETEILTENGWVKFPEYLDSTIKVATLNPSTDAFEWQTPTDIIHMPYSGDMIYTHTRYLDSMVTPNHNHYVSLRTGKGINSRWTPFAKEQASNLVDVVKRVRYKTAASKYIGSTPNTFDITPNANAFATFIGWYTAEGWIHTDNTIAYIAVKAHGRDESILTDLFDNNAFKYKRAYYTTKAAKVSPYGIKTPAGYEMVYFSFYSKELCQWLKDNVGASCYTKHLSSEILGWSSEYLINVWEGFHAGDGEKRSGLITANTKKTWQSRKSFTDRGNRACTVSKDLAESFVELGLKIGASVNYVKNKEVYRISVHAFDYSVAEYRHQTSKVPYDGMVHCVTVPNGLVFVRRNGKVLVSGNSGAYQRNVVGGSLDVAGRNVITPNASFRLDEIGLPKKEAWTLYQDFVIRRLVQNGMDPLVATKEVTNKTKLAEDALRQVVSERPVLATRAPALHKYSIMAFRPRLVESETLQLNPAIQKPFNADHDGDFQVGRVIVKFKRNIDVPFKYRLDF